MKTTVKYGAETRNFNKNEESKLKSIEKYYLRRSTKCPRLEKTTNNIINENINIKNSELDYIRYNRQLNWHIHTRRMNEER